MMYICGQVTKIIQSYFSYFTGAKADILYDHPSIIEATQEKLDTWWRHQMDTFSALLAICAGNSPVHGEFPTQRPVTRSFDGFFDLRLNKRLSKQSWGWWFETLSRPLWRHSNVTHCYDMMGHRRVHIFYLILDSLVSQNEISAKSCNALIQYRYITVSTSKHLIHTILLMLCKLKKAYIGRFHCYTHSISLLSSISVFGSVNRENIAHVYSVRYVSMIINIPIIVCVCKWPYIIRRHICIMMIWMRLYHI